MSKDSSEKKWKEIASNSKKSTKDDDIANLNYDNSFFPIDEEVEEKIPLTEEEKIEVRKKLFILLIAIAIVLVILVIMLISDSFKFSFNGSNEEVVKEEVEEEEGKEVDPISAPIKDLETGEVDLNNSELSILVKEVKYKNYDYYENDTISLFKKDKNLISDLSNKDKLFLLSKTSDFDVLVDEVINQEDICNNNLIISTGSIDKLLIDKFNTKVDNYESFIYSYYDDNSFVNSIQFVKQGENYIGKCYTSNKNIVSFAQQDVVEAYKSENKLIISFRVVFVNKTGVYKDPNFTSLITNENKKFEEYIVEGNIYTYTYDISGSNYYLESVDLLK